MYLIYLVYLYLIIGLLSIYFKKPLPRVYLGLLIFFVFKWIFNYRKCTFSRIECLVRGVKKEEGYLYNFLENMIDIRYCNHIYLIVFIGLFIIIYEIIAKKRFKEMFNME